MILSNNKTLVAILLVAMACTMQIQCMKRQNNEERVSQLDERNHSLHSLGFKWSQINMVPEDLDLEHAIDYCLNNKQEEKIEVIDLDDPLKNPAIQLIQQNQSNILEKRNKELLSVGFLESHINAVPLNLSANDAVEFLLDPQNKPLFEAAQQKHAHAHQQLDPIQQTEKIIHNFEKEQAHLAQQHKTQEQEHIKLEQLICDRQQELAEKHKALAEGMRLEQQELEKWCNAQKEKMRQEKEKLATQQKKIADDLEIKRQIVAREKAAREEHARKEREHIEQEKREKEERERLEREKREQEERMPKECPVCLEDKPKKEFYKLSCDHEYCKACLQDTITNVIAENSSKKLVCPNGTCNQKKITDNDLHMITNNKEQIENIRKIQFKEWVVVQPNAKHCPTPNCPFIFLYEENDEKAIVQCESCKKEYCSNCLVKHDLNIHCKDLKDWEARKKDWEENKIKSCPQCKQRIQRIDGCLYMSCICGHKFCLKCLGIHHVWDNDCHQEHQY